MGHVSMNLQPPAPPRYFDLDILLETVQRQVARDPTWWVLKHFHGHPPLDRERAPGVHPSDLGRNCNRALTYALVNASRSGRKPAPAHLRRTFNHGDVIHLQYQNYLLEAANLGLLEDVKVEVPFSSHHMVGTADAIVVYRGNRYFVEIKSAGPSTFYGTKDLTSVGAGDPKVSSDYLQQVHAYMVGLDLQAGFVLYSDKALDRMKSVWVPFSADVWRPIQRSLDFAAEMVARMALPTKTAKLYQCRDCPFQALCSADAGLVAVDTRT